MAVEDRSLIRRAHRVYAVMGKRTSGLIPEGDNYGDRGQAADLLALAPNRTRYVAFKAARAGSETDGVLSRAPKLS